MQRNVRMRGGVRSRVGGAGAGAGGGSGAPSASFTSVLSPSASGTSTRDGSSPGASTTTTCLPTSTGSARPTLAGPRSISSKRTLVPSGASSGRRNVIRGTRGSTDARCCRAKSARASPCAVPRSTPCCQCARALASRPMTSSHSARLMNVPTRGLSRALSSKRARAVGKSLASKAARPWRKSSAAGGDVGGRRHVSGRRSRRSLRAGGAGRGEQRDGERRAREETSSHLATHTMAVPVGAAGWRDEAGAGET